MDRLVDDDNLVERLLRWAMIEQGTAGLSDVLGAETIAPARPSSFVARDAAVAGRVLLLRRQRPAEGQRPPSSFDVLRGAVKPGAVVMVHCEPGIGAAFGSNIVLQAATCRAQAVVTDGAWRDATRLRSVGIPVGSNGSDPTRPAGCPVVRSESEEMFGLTWRNGDWFLRDADGVLRLDDAAARDAASELAASASGEVQSLLGTTAPREP
jgi:regulator of RNase E activity RraA